MSVVSTNAVAIPKATASVSQPLCFHSTPRL